MPKKRYRPEDIIGKLREADVLLSQVYVVLKNENYRALILYGFPLRPLRLYDHRPTVWI